MTEKNLKLELFDDYIKTTETAGSVVSEKLITYENFTDLFAKEKDVDTGLLPGEYGTQRVIVKNNTKYVLYLEPAKVVSVKHEDSNHDAVDDAIDPDDYDDDDDYYEARREYIRENKDVNTYSFTTPILCWMVAMEGTRYVEAQVFAMKTPIMTGLEPLYHAPFSNIYGHGGICWGYNDVALPTPKAIQGLSTLFFNADANMDLAEQRFSRYTRKYFPGEAFYPIHLHMDVDKMLEETTPEEALRFVQSVLIRKNSSVNSEFQRFVERY